MTVEALKLDLISKIMTLKDASKLKKLEATLKEIWSEDNEAKEVIQSLNKPMRKRLDIEELKRSQNFKPIDKESFFQKMDELNIKESIDDLLKMI